MADKEFLDLVKRMRAAQREYFRTRAEAAKVRAIGLEREVDAEVDRRTAPPPAPTLFDDAGAT